MRILLTLLAPLFILAASPTLAALNDTGQTQCYAGGALTVCSEASTGNTATQPRQDGRFGRDPMAGASQLAKTGGGTAGFDFTPLDATGNPIALSGGAPTSTPACVRDNVTGLIWEVKTIANAATIYTFVEAATYAADSNTAGLCGSSSGWRVPTLHELLSIVHHGTSNPAIDTVFFPNTQNNWYWCSDIFAPDPGLAWSVYFPNGHSDSDNQAFHRYVRLVRSGL